MAAGDRRTPPKRGNTTGWEIDRRAFMRLVAVAGAGACAPPGLQGCNGCGSGGGGQVTLRTRVRRPEDLLNLDISLINLFVDDGVLTRSDPMGDAFVVFDLPPQHVMERVLRYENDDDEALATPLASMLSGPSRLVFRMPEDGEPVPWSLEPLLEAVQGWELSVSAHARARGGVAMPGDDGDNVFVPNQIVQATPLETIEVDTVQMPSEFQAASTAHRNRQTDALAVQATPPQPPVDPSPELDFMAMVGPGVPEQPKDSETAIELPTRLIISPHRDVRFLHSVAPETSPQGRVALWHTQMFPLGPDGTPDARNTPLSTIRGLWARGPGFDPEDASLEGADDPFPNPLKPLVRSAIVHQSSNYADLRVDGEHVQPQPVQVEKLLLSSLGAWFDAQGDWTPKDDIDVFRWLQNTTLGRDHYVEYAQAGYLYPYGHDAVLVTVSQREIRRVPQQGGPRYAALTQFSLLVMKDMARDYESDSENGSVQRALRAWPFSRVRFTERVSARLTPPEGDGPYLPNVGGDTYRMAARVLDREHRPHETNLAVVWIPGRPDEWPTRRSTVRGLFEGNEELSLGGARVAYAPADADGESRYETHTLNLQDEDLGASTASSAGLGAPFLPQVTAATIAVEAARTMVGSSDPLPVVLSERFLDEGFGGGNPGQLLFELTGDALELPFGQQSDKSGGFVSPDFAATAISRLNGLTGGNPMTIASGNYDPAEFLGDMLPKLFGAIPLTTILEAAGVDLSNAPKLVSEGADEIEALLGDFGRLSGSGGTLMGDLGGLDVQSLEAAGYELVQDRIDAVQMAVQAGLDKVSELATAIGSLDVDFLLGEDGIESLLPLLDALRDAIDAAPFLPPSTRAPLREAVERVRAVLAKIDPVLEAIEALLDAKEMLENRTVRLEWRPTLKGDEQGYFVPHRNDGLVLGAEIRAKAVGGKPAGADIYCALEKFDVVIIGPNPVFSVRFDRIGFSVNAGKKPDVDVIIEDIVFDGPLKFIEKIKSILPLDGFSDPPAIDVDASGLRANFSIPLPNVSVGVFALENMSIGAGFEIPFIGDSIALRFEFCSRENPFLLTVMMLGGGGFVGMELTPAGIRLLEVSLEFGASLSVDFGVASGGVSIVAGVYIMVEGDDALLNGYLRFRGHVQVLGIIGASITLSMELTYLSQGNKVIGKAELTIEVSVLCFSASVTVTAERKFSGENEDPTFADAMAPLSLADPVAGSDQSGTPWAQYVNAFA